MAAKRQLRAANQEPSTFDVGLVPLYPVGKGGTARKLSAEEMFVRQTFNKAVEADLKAVVQLMKIVKRIEREQAKQQSRGMAVRKERRGREIISADVALQLLGIASEDPERKLAHLMLEPWALERAEIRMSKYARQQVRRRGPYIRSADAPEPAPYHLEGDPNPVAARPKRSPEGHCQKECTASEMLSVR